MSEFFVIKSNSIDLFVQEDFEHLKLEVHDPRLSELAYFEKGYLAFDTRAGAEYICELFNKARGIDSGNYKATVKEIIAIPYINPPYTWDKLAGLECVGKELSPKTTAETPPEKEPPAYHLLVNRMDKLTERVRALEAQPKEKKSPEVKNPAYKLEENLCLKETLQDLVVYLENHPDESSRDAYFQDNANEDEVNLCLGTSFSGLRKFGVHDNFLEEL